MIFITLEYLLYIWSITSAPRLANDLAPGFSGIEGDAFPHIGENDVI